MTERFTRALPFGATVLEGGETRFRLWAPAEQSVAVCVEGSEPFAMHRGPEGWFEAVVPCRAGARYRYRLTDGTMVPDPASRFQPDDVHGPSMVVDPRAHVWNHGGWAGRAW